MTTKATITAMDLYLDSHFYVTFYRV